MNCEGAALRRWLLERALPLWWEVGADRAGGGFHEAIALDGTPSPNPHRARSIARMAFCYCEAGRLGWRGPWREAARHALRQERSCPLLEILRAELEAAGRKALPSSALGKGVNYTLSLWQKLTRFLDHPQIELSSNLAENSMRRLRLLLRALSFGATGLASPNPTARSRPAVTPWPTR